jgi:carbon monoxide dehydrogenase subunit G
VELEHRFTVPTSVVDTWEAFNDLERVAPCFPGASLTSVEGDDFTGSVKVRLGPISLLYNGTGRFVERDESARRAVIEAKGKDKRGNGTASATVRAQLTPDGEQTAVEVVTDLSITGKPAQFGRGVIQDVSDKLLGQFVSCLEQNLGATAEPAAAPEASAPESTAVESTPTDSAAEHTAPKPQETPSSSGEGELNLLTTVGPALAKRYAVPAIGVLLLLLLLRKLLRH